MATRELTFEEGKALTEDLQEVLKKHNAELGVVSSIQLLKRVEDEDIPDVSKTEETGNGIGEDSKISA